MGGWPWKAREVNNTQIAGNFKTQNRNFQMAQLPQLFWLDPRLTMTNNICFSNPRYGFRGGWGTMLVSSVLNLDIFTTNLHTASERKGHTSKRVEDFHIKMAQVKARIWPWLAYLFQVRSTADRPKNVARLLHEADQLAKRVTRVDWTRLGWLNEAELTKRDWVD